MKRTARPPLLGPGKKPGNVIVTRGGGGSSRFSGRGGGVFFWVEMVCVWREEGFHAHGRGVVWCGEDGTLRRLYMQGGGEEDWGGGGEGWKWEIGCVVFFFFFFGEFDF